MSAGLAVGVLAAAAAAAGCVSEGSELLLASTTSTEDSGLFDVLLPAFMEAQPGVVIRVTAVGSGQALELGRRRDADVLLVHSPRAESAFVEAGHGVARCQVMYNDFVLVGPRSDPAGAAGAAEASTEAEATEAEATGAGPARGADVTAALGRIAATGAEFISRGDDSGTHVRERSLWQAAGVEPAGSWYMEIGQGMAEVLQMASERGAYALTDRATYLNHRPRLRLALHVEGDDRLFNPYGVIPVAGARHAGAARAFARWITGGEAQALIGQYGVEAFGRPLFVPDADGCALRPEGEIDGDP